MSKLFTKQVAVAAAALILAACAGSDQKTLERPVVSAPTVVVEASTIPSVRAVAGTVRSANVSPLAAKVMGNVVRVHVAEGDHVRAGQLLVEIDSREGRAQTDRARAGAAEIDSAITAARANATFAETTFNRYAALRERQSVSPQELDDVRTRYESARAELARLLAKRDEVRAAGAQAATFLDYSFVRAPFDGVVTARMVDHGAQAAPGMPLVTIEDARTLRIDAAVPEGMRVAQGDIVTIEAAGTRLEGTIAHVQPSVDGRSRSSLIKIVPLVAETGQSAPLRSGAYVRVLIRTGERRALTVPASALVRRGQLTSVFVVDGDGVARMRLVTLGEQNEVLSGLAAGERIVIDASGVRDGVNVS